MNPIDQIADERDKLRVKLKKANFKLRLAKLRMDALTAVRDHALQTVDRAHAANVRARAMICDAAGIPHDADILAWISGARERIARMEEAGDAMANVLVWSAGISYRRSPTALAWRKAKEAKL